MFGVEVPVRAHHLAEPDKGSGIAMICTFGDLNDVTWWRELQLDTRGDRRARRADRRRATAGLEGTQARSAYRTPGRRDHPTARERTVELLEESGDLDGDPRPVTHSVKFYEKGNKPLEIVTSRQWYLRNGGRDLDLREELLARGKELHWVPDYMRVRYENWVQGLTGDWLVSRQRFFGVAFPVWYPPR